MQQATLGTEAIRAFFTLQCCWLNSEEIYLEQGCLHCGSAATYLIYFTNTHIQKHLLDFIAQYRCVHNQGVDLLYVENFEQHYSDFLQILEKEINYYASQYHDLPRQHAFESIDSIFERTFAIAC
ncbi:hypothetical protein ACUM6W_09955 [Acinetobacter tandoii]|jgi:hypothetical protein|uniref:hypothetical protein n=1 Tax=Acinetobacter tandoii TaxID=202954 RepID=UPI004045E367